MTDEFLHLLARAFLRFLSPRRAYSFITRIGDTFPRLGAGSEELRRAGLRLRKRGTCLSRALAMAARVPDAHIVIAVAPREGQPLFAHAWIEVAGSPIDPSDVAGAEIARLARGGRSV